MPTSAPAPVASTTVADNSSFGGPTAAQAAAANAVIATSSTSRAATTSNINTLQTALNNVPPPPGAPGSSTNGGPNAQQNTPTGTSLPASTQTTTTPTTNSGGNSNGGSAYTPPTTATQVSLPGGATGYYTPANGTTPESMTDAQGNALTYSQSVGGWIDPTTGTAPVATSASSGGSGSDGSSGTDVNASAVSGLPPDLQAIAKSNLDNLDAQYAQAQSSVTAAAANLANDPALASAISSIQGQYKVLYDAMGLKNQQVLGRAASEVGAFGGLGVMNQSFLSNEMDAAQTRLSDIISKEQAAIINAQAAYNKGDVAALDAATSQLKDAQTAKSTAVSQLLTATNNAVKTQQAQAKIDQTATNSQITNDIKNAKGVADSLAAKLAAAGITDLSSYDYTDIAKQLGINSPEILAAAVQAAGDASTKANLGNANVADQIANRDAGTQIKQQNADKTKAASTSTFKVSDGIAKVTPQMKAEVKSSGSTDGYIDPAKWIAARDNWQALGGTAASFKSNFIQYLNPASYTKAGYKAPAAAAGASPYNTN